MNKIIVYLFAMICYPIALYSMGSSDTFQIVIRFENAHEKIIDWHNLVPHSSIDDPMYNNQLKAAAQKGFNRIVKRDNLDFIELEAVIVEKRLKPILTKFQELRTVQKDLVVENDQLKKENARLVALLAQTQQMVKAIGSEAQQLLEDSQHLDRDENFKLKMNVQPPPPVPVVVPEVQKKSHTKLFCALFVTGGMLWGLKYFFNK